MALIKNVTLNSGIVTKYHRIVSINHIINKTTIIEVASYISEDKRLEEISALEKGESMNIFINSKYYNTEYNPNLTPESAYELIKTFPEFKSAKNDI